MTRHANPCRLALPPSPLLLQVGGIMMNEYTGADVTTKLHEEQWLTSLQATAGRRRSVRRLG